MNKFRYVIFPDRTYTLEYEGYRYEVTGEEILATFYRDAMMDKWISDWTDDPDTPENSYWDIGEL